MSDSIFLATLDPYVERNAAPKHVKRCDSLKHSNVEPSHSDRDIKYTGRFGSFLAIESNRSSGRSFRTHHRQIHSSSLLFPQIRSVPVPGTCCTRRKFLFRRVRHSPATLLADLRRDVVVLFVVMRRMVGGGLRRRLTGRNDKTMRKKTDGGNSQPSRRCNERPIRLRDL